VPEQIRFHRDWGRHPKTPLVWEMQLCAWSSGIFLGATGFVLALRAVLRSDFWLAAVLAPVGLGLAGFCYRGAAHLLSRVRRCYQVPAPAPRTKGRSQAPALSPESLH
jgi:hypothetical protein